MIHPLLDNNKFLFDSQYSLDISQEILIKQFLYLFKDRKKRNQANTYYIFEDNKIVHAKILDWDTKYFGFTMAKLDSFITYPKELFEETFSEFEKWIISKNISHLSFRCNINDFETFNFLVKVGFEVMANKIMLRLNCNTYKPILYLDKEITIRTFKIDDYNELSTIINENFTLDRFHQDPNINKKLASNLYVNWFKSICEDKQSNIIVAELNNKPVGVVAFSSNMNEYRFISCEKKMGFVSLITTKKNMKNRGIGKALLNYAIQNLINEYNVEVVYANTDLRNVSSSLMFQKAGFTVFNCLTELRKWYGIFEK